MHRRVHICPGFSIRSFDLCESARRPAMERAEFAKWRQTTLLGASLRIVAPTGQYDPTKLINWGTNPVGIQTGARLFAPARKQLRYPVARRSPQQLRDRRELSSAGCG